MPALARVRRLAAARSLRIQKVTVCPSQLAARTVSPQLARPEARGKTWQAAQRLGIGVGWLRLEESWGGEGALVGLVVELLEELQLLAAHMFARRP